MENLTRAKIQAVILSGMFVGFIAYGLVHYSNIEQGYRDELERARIESFKQALQGAQQSADSSRKALQQLQEEISKVTTKHGPADIETRLAAIRAEVKRNQADIARTRDALVDNPEKAVSIPLLKKDVENLVSAEKRDVDQLRTEMGRMYDQTRWIIGLMFTLVFGLFSTVVIQFWWPRRKSESATETKQSVVAAGTGS